MRVFPNEIYVVIREFLYSLRVDEELDPIEMFICLESEWSWRNFLSASNCEEWQTIRKSTRLWSLNKFSSLRYLKDGSFREYVNSQCIYPIQLSCNFPEADADLERIRSTITTEKFGALFISNYPTAQFPSLNTLIVLKLDGNNEGLVQLGDFENLQYLSLFGCKDLTSCGRMENLIDLEIEEISAKQIFDLLPLENLMNLSLYGLSDNFLSHLERLHNLRKLHLFLDSTDELGPSGDLPPLLCPYLETLECDCFVRIDLSGLSSLKTLILENININEVKGKEEIFPQLKKFSYHIDVDNSNDEWLINMTVLHLLRNVTDLALTGEQAFEEFEINEKIQSLTLVQPIQKLVTSRMDRPLRYLSLSTENWMDLSMFSNCNQVSLYSLMITDISLLKDVPYLILHDLTEVEDFSCLGNQRYLNIAYCPELKDDDFDHLGNVFSLLISNCRDITTIRGNQLLNNRMLSINFCGGLREVELSGQNYIQVSFKYCHPSSRVTVSGRVYSLYISKFGEDVHYEHGATQNCDYFNGKLLQDI
jgi:hypothetical protein